MKNVRIVGFAALLFVFFLAACTLPGPPTARPMREAAVSAPLPSEPASTPAPQAYSGRKATVSFESVEGLNLIPSGWGGVAVSPEINAVFGDELAATNRFRVLSRGQIKTILKEQDLATSGRVSKGTAVKSGEITGSDLLIVPKITGFDPGYENTNAALGAIAGLSSNPWIQLGGLIFGGIRKSRIEMTVQVFDSRTSELDFSQPFEGECTDWRLGGGAGIGGFRGGVAGGVNHWNGTPMANALRIVVQTAVSSMVARLDQSYYKH